jgi:hypothetical protein
MIGPPYECESVKYLFSVERPGGMVTLLRDHVLERRLPRQGSMVTQKRDHATRRHTLNAYHAKA